MTQRIKCSNCNVVLSIPAPRPEKVSCPNCRTVLRVPVVAEVYSATAPPGPHAAGNPTTAINLADFTIDKELARGGLGVVYLAYNNLDNSSVAIKRPNTGNNATTNELHERFLREVDAVGQLRSNHIVKAIGTGTDKNGPYLVLEYLDGDSLGSVLSWQKQLPVAHACEVIRQAALGLQTAHEAKLVHRDIKPSNLMLARMGSGSRIVIIDWGLVKRTDSDEPQSSKLTTVHTELGTPDYMPPEQMTNPGGVDIRADIYSLGVTLYCLLTGYPPFHEKQRAEKLIAQAKAKFPPLTAVRTDIPQGLLTILERMVEKSPAQRPATPGDVARALHPYCRLGSHQLLSLLARRPAHPIQAIPANPANKVTDDKTKLVTEPGIPGNPPTEWNPGLSSQNIAAPVLPPARKKPTINVNHILFGGLAIVGLALVVFLFFWMSGGEKDDDEPKVLINENFSKAFEDKELLPEGWSDSGLRVVIEEEDKYALESTELIGTHFVTLPPLTLRDNFTIKVEFFDHIFIHLVDSKDKILAINVASPGKVQVSDDSNKSKNVKDYPPPKGYMFKPVTEFKLKRIGKKFRFFLNDVPLEDYKLEEVKRYDKVRVGLTGLKSNADRFARIYRIKITDDKETKDKNDKDEDDDKSSKS